MTLRLIVFDLDGTLVDSRRDLAQSANALLAECGCRQLSEDAIGRMIDLQYRLAGRDVSATDLEIIPPD